MGQTISYHENILNINYNEKVYIYNVKYYTQVLWQYTTIVAKREQSVWESLCKRKTFDSNILETFTMYDSRTRLIIFLFRDPHLLEGGERCQNGTTDPNRVFSLWRSDDLDFDGWWSQGSDFLLHTISNTLKRIITLPFWNYINM